jgi:hypothetical protein
MNVAALLTILDLEQEPAPAVSEVLAQRLFRR